MPSEPHPPESIDDPAIGVEVAARLMASVGFVVFRAPPEADAPDSWLMVAIHDVPTRRHFDAERLGFWATVNGHGQLQELDRSAEVPFSSEFSWGRVRLTDRFGARNSFVTFGGVLSGELVGAGARLFIFRSPALILRLAGHSQREDRLAPEAMAFFALLIPHLWSGEAERTIAEASPLDLFAAFLLHTRARIARSRTLREALERDEPALRRQLALLETTAPAHLEAGANLLRLMGLQPAGADRRS
jgi:hypothetical protein